MNLDIVLAKMMSVLLSMKFWTFMAVMVALFGKRIRDWWDRPIIEISFNPVSDRCYRSASPNIDSIQSFPGFTPCERQYFRLRVHNSGGSTAKKVRVVVDIYYENMEEAERFEPNRLIWIIGGTETDIASGETTYINLLSHVTKLKPKSLPIPPNLTVIRWEIDRGIPRGIAWDRETRKYIIKLIVHGDNISAKQHWFKYAPDKSNVFKVGALKKICVELKRDQVPEQKQKWCTISIMAIRKNGEMI